MSADREELRCIVCHARFYSWGDLAPHERQCIEAARKPLRATAPASEEETQR